MCTGLLYIFAREKVLPESARVQEKPQFRPALAMTNIACVESVCLVAEVANCGLRNFLPLPLARNSFSEVICWEAAPFGGHKKLLAAKSVDPELSNVAKLIGAVGRPVHTTAQWDCAAQIQARTIKCKASSTMILVCTCKSYSEN